MLHHSLKQNCFLFLLFTRCCFLCCVQMLSTVVKHKKDGGQSGGVFDSYNIIRVRGS